MSDALALGIFPPATVRIDMGGWIQDWPHNTITVQPTEILVEALGRPLVRYPYEHAHQQDDGSWVFHGRESFTITAGPPQPPALN